MKKLVCLISVSAVFILLGGFLVFDLYMPRAVTAETDDNVSGFAWSENIGWISMNCRNQELQTPRCKDSDYGVNIEDTGNLTGYAWSENIGWINFAPAGPYPQNPQYSVKTDLKTGALSGWARALAYGGGWDGWLSMRGQSPDHGVDIDTFTGDFSGWAWGEDKVGWVSFAGANYKTKTSFSFNHEPVVSELSVDQGNYCVLAFHPVFYWDFSDQDVGDFQNAYQVQIDDDADIEASPLIDSCSPDPGTCASGHAAKSYTPASPSAFDYNTTYYWRVRVWDNRGGVSEWAQSQFTTPLHKYPEPIFTWAPLRPSIGEFAQFCATAEPGVCQSDVAKCYNILGQQISCSGSVFVWEFPAGIEFSTTTSAFSENPKVKFPATGWQVVTLSIDDDVGDCSVTKDIIRISSPLPKWREIAP